MRRLSAPILVLFLAACGSVRLVEVQQSDLLYFGTSRTGAPAVADAEWHAFVEEVITPRFPGFTEWSAVGHWQREEERTHVVQIIHKRRMGEERKVAEIVAEYKRRFRQESVLWVRTEALATFE